MPIGNPAVSEILSDIRSGAAACLFVDVQQDYFDEMRLRVHTASEETRRRLAVIGGRIASFSEQLQTKAPEVKRIWAVHTHSRQLKALKGSRSALVSELVAKPPKGDDVIAKDGFCAFGATPLSSLLESGGIQTLLLCGGIFEYCILKTCRTAIEKGGVRVAIIPDMTAAEGGVSGYKPLKARFRDHAINWGDIQESISLVHSATVLAAPAQALTRPALIPSVGA